MSANEQRPQPDDPEGEEKRQEEQEVPPESEEERVVNIRLDPAPQGPEVPYVQWVELLSRINRQVERVREDLDTSKAMSTWKMEYIAEYSDAPQSIILSQTVILKPIYEKWCSFYSLKKQRATLSTRTMYSSPTFISTQHCYTACETLEMLGIPTLLFFTSFLDSHSNQNFVNALLLIASSHGSVGTAAMLLMNRNYREKLTRCFSKCRSEKGTPTEEKNHSDSRVKVPIQQLPMINIKGGAHV
ncbi:hypothetical protein Aduo_000633 [Ancylostoma duodenale]